MSAGSSASPPGDEGRVAGPEEQLHRVKVYKLNEDGKWDDKGTGHVTMENLDSPGASGPCPGLVVIADNLQTLLIHRISRDDIYTRSHPTIMTWSDPSMGTDIALSFQLESGCSSIWAKIGEARQELALGPPSPTHDPRDEPSDRAASPPAELPPIELGTVGEVGKILADISIFQRERIAAQVIRCVRCSCATYPLPSPFSFFPPPFSPLLACFVLADVPQYV